MMVDQWVNHRPGHGRWVKARETQETPKPLKNKENPIF
jgi:hypothetical protein